MAQNKRIQDALAKLESAQAESQVAFEGVAADIAFIKESLPATGGLTEAEVEELATSLEASAAKAQAAADALKALDAETDSDGEEDPEVPEEPIDPEVPEEDEDDEEGEEPSVGAQFIPS